MTIRNKDAFDAQQWDWGFLDGCFGNTNIRVTDVDGLVERNGQFLMIESKGAGVPIPLGQKIMHDQWVRRGNSLLVVWGEPNIPLRIEFRSNIGGLRTREVESASIPQFQELVGQWFRTVDKWGSRNGVYQPIDGHESNPPMK